MIITGYKELPKGKRIGIATEPFFSEKDHVKAKLRVRTTLKDWFTNGGMNNKYSFKIVDEHWSVHEAGGYKFLQLTAIIESDAFTPINFMDWQQNRGLSPEREQEVFMDFINSYTLEHPKWNEITN